MQGHFAPIKNILPTKVQRGGGGADPMEFDSFQFFSLNPHPGDNHKCIKHLAKIYFLGPGVDKFSEFPSAENSLLSKVLCMPLTIISIGELTYIDSLGFTNLLLSKTRASKTVDAPITVLCHRMSH